MRVALTGASGFIGAAVAERLTRAGHRVTGLLRSSSRRDHLEGMMDRFVTGDQADPAAWDEMLEDADAVVINAVDWEAVRSGDLSRHLAANVTAPIELLHRSRPRPVVFMSSIAVHHEMLDRWEGVIDEDHPARPGGLYGAAKAAVEMHLFAERAMHDRHVVSLRPCAVYGIDPRPERTIGWPIVDRLRETPRYDRPGGGKFVRVDDVAEATLGALERPEAAGRVYNLVDCYARWSDIAGWIAEELGLEAEIDDSSQAEPRNHFDVSAARSLGARLEYGHAGLREHVRRLVALRRGEQ